MSQIRIHLPLCIGAGAGLGDLLTGESISGVFSLDSAGSVGAGLDSTGEGDGDGDLGGDSSRFGESFGIGDLDGKSKSEALESSLNNVVLVVSSLLSSEKRYDDGPLGLPPLGLIPRPLGLFDPLGRPRGFEQSR